VGELQIAGYSDLRPGDAGWWKFDLPPGWEAWRRAPLPEVAAFQWSSAQRALLETELPAEDRLLLRFEDLLGPGRRAALDRLARWLGLPPIQSPADPRLAEIPPVMATAPPRAGRWYEAAPLLREVVGQAHVRALAHRLGYPDMGP
jgi:hypothetical protein